MFWGRYNKNVRKGEKVVLKGSEVCVVWRVRCRAGMGMSAGNKVRDRL